MTSFLHVDLHIAAIGKRRTMIILAKLYVLHSFKCYLHENLDLIIIFFTLLQFFLFKTMYFSKYYHCSSFRLFDFSDIFVFLVEKKNNDNISQIISFLLLSLFISIVKMMIKYIILL
jgi:hypothetical protein